MQLLSSSARRVLEAVAQHAALVPSGITSDELALAVVLSRTQAQEMLTALEGMRQVRCTGQRSGLGVGWVLTKGG